MNSQEIEIIPTETYSDDTEEVEALNAKGESSTQIPKLYKLPVTFSGRHYLLNILDTPGIRDTEGFERDIKNKQAIIDKVSQIR